MIWYAWCLAPNGQNPGESSSYSDRELESCCCVALSAGSIFLSVSRCAGFVGHWSNRLQQLCRLLSHCHGAPKASRLPGACPSGLLRFPRFGMLSGRLGLVFHVCC